MHEVAVETLFAKFAATGDADALAAVFDRTAGKLLLVAAHLAGGSVAEDVVQATFVDAIRQRRRWDTTRPLAPWLIGLLANHAREARRQRARVPDPSRLAARAADAADAQAEANEVFAAVATAVDALPRHYRQVLSLRLVHGLELQQIAHSLDVPLGTVKVRVHRGLALLRRALPAGLTASFALLATPRLGLAAARQAVLAEAAAVAGAGAGAGGAAIAAGTAIAFGGWLMKNLVLGAAALALAAAGWFTFAPTDAAAPATALREPSVRALVAGAAASEGTARSDAPIAAADPATPRTAERSEAATTGSLLVECVWRDGAPASSVALRARRTKRGEVAASTRAKCGADGHAQFDALEPGEYFVIAILADQDTARLEVHAGEQAKLRLEIGGDQRLNVAVVDATGAAVRGANIWVEDPYDSAEPLRSIGTTDASGEFSWRGLPVSTVFARHGAHEPSALHTLPEVRGAELPREPIDVRLTLGPAACTVAGSVVDPHGRPAAGARVAIACDDGVKAARVELVVITDALGRFLCNELPVGERSVVASMPGFAPAILRITTSPSEPAAAHLRLRTGATLTGRATDAEGKPLADLYLQAASDLVAHGLHWGFGQHASGRTDADGRYELRAIPAGTFTASFGVEPPLEKRFTAEDGAQLTWDPVREPEHAIHGIVVDADGKPLSRWRLTATAPPASNRATYSPSPCQTDAAGRFRMTGLEDAPYRLFVFAPLHTPDQVRSAAANVATAIVDDVWPSAESRTIEVPAAAMPAAWLEGSLVLPEGTNTRVGLSLYPKAMQGGVFTVPQERLEVGTTTYRIGPLPPGEYSLVCEVEGRAQLSHRGFVLGASETRRLPPFAFDAQRPCIVLLRRDDGRPAAGGNVQLKSSRMPFREVAPGRYESQPVDEGSDEVTVRGPDFAPGTFAVTRSAAASNELTVRGATPVTVRLLPPTPRNRWIDALRVAVTDAQGAKVVDDMIQLDGASDFKWPIGLPPGTYTMAFDLYGDGKASTTATVGSEPLQIDLQLKN